MRARLLQLRVETPRLIDFCMAAGFQEAVTSLRALDIASPPSPEPTRPPTSTETVEASATSKDPPFNAT